MFSKEMPVRPRSRQSSDEVADIKLAHDIADLIRDLRAEIERLQSEDKTLRGAVLHLHALLLDACEVLDHYDLPEHARHYRAKLAEGGG